MKRLILTCLLLGNCGSLAADDPLAFASGSWFNPTRDGEGFVVQLLPEDVSRNPLGVARDCI